MLKIKEGNLTLQSIEDCVDVKQNYNTAKILSILICKFLLKIQDVFFRSAQIYYPNLCPKFVLSVLVPNKELPF